jgi:outer membrane protein assembly factor BamB
MKIAKARTLTFSTIMLPLILAVLLTVPTVSADPATAWNSWRHDWTNDAASPGSGPATNATLWTATVVNDTLCLGLVVGDGAGGADALFAAGEANYSAWNETNGVNLWMTPQYGLPTGFAVDGTKVWSSDMGAYVDILDKATGTVTNTVGLPNWGLAPGIACPSADAMFFETMATGGTGSVVKFWKSSETLAWQYNFPRGPPGVAPGTDRPIWGGALTPAADPYPVAGHPDGLVFAAGYGKTMLAGDWYVTVIDAIDMATGVQVWRYTLNTGAAFQGTGGITTHTAPVVSHGRGLVWAADHSGNVTCLDELTGAWVWNTTLPTTVVEGKQRANSQLALDDQLGLLFVHNDASNTLFCLNATTGAVLGQIATGGTTLPGGPVLSLQERLVYVQLAPPFGAPAGQEWVHCYAYNAAGALTGPVWTYAIPGSEAVQQTAQGVENSPALADWHLFVAGCNNGTVTLIVCFGDGIGPPPFIPEFFASFVPILIVVAVIPAFYYIVKHKQAKLI